MSLQISYKSVTLFHKKSSPDPLIFKNFMCKKKHMAALITRGTLHECTLVLYYILFYCLCGSGGRAGHPLITRLVVQSHALPVCMSKCPVGQDTEPHIAEYGPWISENTSIKEHSHWGWYIWCSFCCQQFYPSEFITTNTSLWDAFNKYRILFCITCSLFPSLAVKPLCQA